MADIKTRKRRFRIRRIKLSQVFLVLGMTLLVCFTALPMVAMVCRAFMPLDELFLYPPRIIVRKPTTANFAELLTSLNASVVPFSRYIFNSLFTTVVSVFLSIIVCCMGAYGLVKFKPYGSKTIFAIIVAALMFSSHVTQIPNYMIVNAMGLVNSYWALIIPKIAVAYNFFLVKQFAEQLPDSVLEAARIDGAGEFTTFWKIAMPLLKPAWSTLAVFSFVSNWNDYFSPLVFINKDAMKTLPLALQTLSGGAGVVARTGTVGAATLLTTVPTIIVFVIMRGRVMQTMTYSGIKS
ncbi:MAG: carbohydrate ABC transporter permease [Lachnospiraceae bacterium]|nr:carbohydrate ABC transporter permease [Lachnospiraceae bacterium]